MKNNIQKIDFKIDALEDMKKYPSELFYIGDTNLLQRTKISIVGSRKPNQYARYCVETIATKLSDAGICIVSGGALGIDTIAHKSAKAKNTIMVAGTGLDKRYPNINNNMIQNIENDGLVLSQFQKGAPSYKYNFPLRNELIVALGDILIVAYADKKSGTMRSVEYALKMGKKIYVLPHQIGQSDGTNKLLEDGLATAIYDIDKFVSKFTKIQHEDGSVDKFLVYCQAQPIYDEAINIYGALVFEYELMGKIKVINGRISQVLST